jgi:hypothetical protein
MLQGFVNNKLVIEAAMKHTVTNQRRNSTVTKPLLSPKYQFTGDDFVLASLLEPPLLTLNESINELETDVDEEGGHGPGSYLIKEVLRVGTGVQGAARSGGEGDRDRESASCCESDERSSGPVLRGPQNGITSRIQATRDLGGLNALFGAAWMNPFVTIEGVTPDILLPDLESVGARNATAGQAPLLRRKISAHVAGPMKPETIAERMLIYTRGDACDSRGAPA